MSTVNSLMTELAEAIRNKSGATGKLSITAMTNAVNGISVNTGGEIDFNGVTVTADKLLAGIVAINSDGEKVTGTIPTVALSQSGNTVSIQPGYTNGGSVTVDVPDVPDFPTYDAATVKVDANTVTITAGLIEAQTFNIPLANITETAESVTIGVGYIGEEKTYNLSSGTISSAEFGYVTADGSIQLYDFNVTPPVEKGSPITADIVTVLPRPYEGDIIEGEYLRFTAVEPSEVHAAKTENVTLLYRKNSGYWVEAEKKTTIPLETGEYVEFYGNYQGTNWIEEMWDDVFEHIFSDFIDRSETENENNVDSENLGFSTKGKLRCSGYINSVSEFRHTLAKGTYLLLMAGCEGVISSPIIPQMTAVYGDKTDDFPFYGLIASRELTEITVEFTSWGSAENVKWLQVAETGTFRKPAALPTIFGERDENELCTCIPPNWTVVNI